MNYEEYVKFIQRIVAGDFENATPKERDDAVMAIIHASSVTSALVSLIPVPLVESPVQIMMVRAIGQVYGQQLDEKVVIEVFSVVGSNYLIRQIVLRFIPGVSWLINPTRVYAMTWAVGMTAEYYFKHNREVEKEELMRVFKTVLKQKTREKEAEVKDRHIEERLNDLKTLFDKGLITQDEYNRKREVIISEL